MLKHSYNGQSSRTCMISPAGSVDPLLVPQLNYSQKGKEKVLFMRRIWPAHCWGQVSQMILAIQGVCKENRQERVYFRREQSQSSCSC